MGDERYRRLKVFSAAWNATRHKGWTLAASVVAIVGGTALAIIFDGALAAFAGAVLALVIAGLNFVPRYQAAAGAERTRLSKLAVQRRAERIREATEEATVNLERLRKEIGDVEAFVARLRLHREAHILLARAIGDILRGGRMDDPISEIEWQNAYGGILRPIVAIAQSMHLPNAGPWDELRDAKVATRSDAHGALDRVQVLLRMRDDEKWERHQRILSQLLEMPAGDFEMAIGKLIPLPKL